MNNTRPHERSLCVFIQVCAILCIHAVNLNSLKFKFLLDSYCNHNGQASSNGMAFEAIKQNKIKWNEKNATR